MECLLWSWVVGDYNIREFWKFTIPQYFIRLLALTAGSLIMFPM